MDLSCVLHVENFINMQKFSADSKGWNDIGDSNKVKALSDLTRVLLSYFYIGLTLFTFRSGS